MAGSKRRFPVLLSAKFNMRLRKRDTFPLEQITSGRAQQPTETACGSVERFIDITGHHHAARQLGLYQPGPKMLHHRSNEIAHFIDNGSIQKTFLPRQGRDTGNRSCASRVSTQVSSNRESMKKIAPIGSIAPDAILADVQIGRTKQHRQRIRRLKPNLMQCVQSDRR